MSSAQNVGRILSSGDVVWIIWLSILGLVVLAIAVPAVFGIVSNFSKRLANCRKRKVKLTSSLYKELELLNKSKKSIKGKEFTYQKGGYVFIRTFKEWQAYDKTNYLQNHRKEFQDDLLHLMLFLDDCTIYRESVSDAWLRWRQNPSSIAASGLSAKKYAKIEKEVCQAITLPIPPEPVLEYDILVECGYQRRKKHLLITRKEVEQFLAPATPIPAATPSDEPNTTTEEPILPVAEAETTISLVPENEPDEPAVLKPFPSSFEEYFDSAENLNSDGYFWLDASEEEREFILKLARDLYSLQVEVFPLIREHIFGFRPMPSADKETGSIFWFQKPAKGAMIFTYLQSGEWKSIIADAEHYDEVRVTAFGLLGMEVTPEVHEDPVVSTEEETDSAPAPLQQTDKSVVLEGNLSNDEIGHSNAAFERYFASIDGLEEEIYIWQRLSEAERLLIKETARIVFESETQLIPKCRAAMFYFLRVTAEESGHRLLFWFKKPSGRPLIFTYRPSPKSEEYLQFSVKKDSMKVIRPIAETLINGESVPYRLFEEATRRPAESVAVINHKEVLAKFPSLASSERSSFYKSRTDTSIHIIDKIILLAFSLSAKIAIDNGNTYLGFGRTDDLDNGFEWFGFRQRLGENLMFFYKEDRYSSKERFIIANIHQLSEISDTVRRLITEDLARPLRSKNLEQDIEKATSLPVSNTPAAVKEPSKNVNLNDKDLFFAKCTISEKNLMKSIMEFVASYDSSLSVTNTHRFLGFRRLPKNGVGTIPFWFWFAKGYGASLKFIYHPTQYATAKYEISVDESKLRLIENRIRKIVGPTRVSPVKKPNLIENEFQIPKEIIDSVPSITTQSYFFETLSGGEKRLVVEVIYATKKLWDNVIAANTKNYFGFRTIGKNYSPYYWFWFSRPRGGAFQFAYRTTPTETEKTAITIKGDSLPEILDVLRKLKGNDHLLPGNKNRPSPSPVSDSNVRPMPVTPVSIWDKPFLYATEIIKAHNLGKTVKTTDISALCTIHHFTYLEAGGVAFNNKYASFSDAIYQSKIVNSENKIYVYSNPYSSPAYDKALIKLQDELKIFDLGEGRYLTMKSLEADNGISYAEAHKLKERIKKYLDSHQFFSLDNLREYCADCRFLEIATTDRIMMQFVHSVFKRGVKTIIADQDSPKAVYSTGLGEVEIHIFFRFITENANATDIYTIKDRVETLFAINYSLDLIGKDAERAGFFYSEDLEKVYKNIKYFYEEIRNETISAG